MNTQSHARRLRQTRSTYHTYPNGGTVRSQAQEMIKRLNLILQNVEENDDVPPWVVMKISQAYESVDSISTYIGYYASLKK